MRDDNVLYYHKVLGHLIAKSAMKSRGHDHKHDHKHDKKNMSKVMTIDYIYDRSLKNEDTYAKDVGRHFGLNKSTTSEMIKGLQKEDMIEMVVDSNDARLKKLILTKKALKLIENERSSFEEFYKLVTKDLSQKEINDYIDVSKKMIKNLKEAAENDKNII